MQKENQVLDRFIKRLDAKKATNIRTFHMKDPTLTDYILVVSVSNPIHGRAVLNEVSELIKDVRNEDESSDILDHPKVSGTVGSGWIVVDLNSIVIHIIDEELRDYYRLDDLFETHATVYHY